MAKFRPKRAAQPKTPQIRQGLPCIILLLLGFILVSVLVLAMLRGG